MRDNLSISYGYLQKRRVSSQTTSYVRSMYTNEMYIPSIIPFSHPTSVYIPATITPFPCFASPVSILLSIHCGRTVDLCGKCIIVFPLM